MIEPGSTIGVLGGGQLGRMTGQAARALGYGFAVYEPQTKSPAGHVADLEINAPYSDESALRRLAERRMSSLTNSKMFPWKRPGC